MKKIEKLIPHAIKVIKDAGITDGMEVRSEYNGYISSFGASITRSGLLPTVIFFENEDSDTNAKRHLVPKALLHLIGQQFNHEKLSDYVMKNDTSHTEKLSEISDAAVALKIALRTYKILN